MPDVNVRGGICLQLVAKSANVELLWIVIKVQAHQSSISSAIPHAMSISQRSTRLKIIQILLKSGASGRSVSEALVEASRLGQAELDLINTLLSSSEARWSSVGEILTNAVMFCPKRIVLSVIAKCNPSPMDTQAAFQCLFNDRVQERFAKAALLLRGTLNPHSVSEGLLTEMTTSRQADQQLVELLVDHGARCDHAHGKPLELSIQRGNSTTLRTMLKKGLDSRLLAQQSSTAMRIEDRKRRCGTMSLLLKAGARGPEINELLFTEACKGRYSDLVLVKILVDHGAEVDTNDPTAIQSMLDHPVSLELMKLLSRTKNFPEVAKYLIQPAMQLSSSERFTVMDLILTDGIRSVELDTALINATEEDKINHSMVDLLLRKGASADFGGGDAVNLAIQRSNVKAAEYLLANVNKRSILDGALDAIMALPRSPTRLSMVKSVTRANIHGSQRIHAALLRSTREADHDVMRHLLESGGDPTFDSGNCIRSAARRFDPLALRLLVASSSVPEFCCDGFSEIMSKMNRWDQPANFLEIVEILVQNGANGPAVEHSLAEATGFHDRKVAEQFVNTITDYFFIDVDSADGKALSKASERNNIEIVRQLLSYEPSLDTIGRAFLALFESDALESCLIEMVKVFLDHVQDIGTASLFWGKSLDSPIYQTLHRHPDKPSLLATLLLNGGDIEPDIPWQFMLHEPEAADEIERFRNLTGCEADEEDENVEHVSPLIWILCQDDPRLEPSTIEVLLDNGGRSAFFFNVRTFADDDVQRIPLNAHQSLEGMLA